MPLPPLDRVSTVQALLTYKGPRKINSSVERVQRWSGGAGEDAFGTVTTWRKSFATATATAIAIVAAALCSAESHLKSRENDINGSRSRMKELTLHLYFRVQKSLPLDSDSYGDMTPATAVVRVETEIADTAGAVAAAPCSPYELAI